MDALVLPLLNGESLEQPGYRRGRGYNGDPPLSSSSSFSCFHCHDLLLQGGQCLTSAHSWAV